ncbi:helix-turn-helix domain-containing protein [Promethearchaeum syntrophicum]|uniref:Helix-turn-helix domain-containing protein n=1 Tax=Promethearchaeum syntrophicum TaxID=2594042 RepID=A0AC61ZU24_9ARCH
MPRKINQENDKKVLDYLKNHTYIETTEKLGVSSRTIKRIKDRNNPTESKAESKVNSKVNDEIKESLNQILKLFEKAIEIEPFLKLTSEQDFKAMEKIEKEID